MEQIPKPRELLAAQAACEGLFATLRGWFAVPDGVTIDLRAVDSAVGELNDPQLVMAMAMRKLQALHLLSTPGVRTTTDVVLTVVQDLERALRQAPSLHLRTEAQDVDWDAELAALGSDGAPNGDEDPDLEPADSEPFDEIERFRRQHAVLRAAARAVLRASDGKICVLQ